MDQRENHIRTDIEDTRTAMTEKIDMIENRMHETMQGTQSTIDNIMDSVKRVQGTVEEAKSTVDNIIQTVKYTMDETIERVKYTTDLFEQVNQNPWIMFGSAVLIGYVLRGINQGESLAPRHAQAPRVDHSEPVRPGSSGAFSTAP